MAEETGVGAFFDVDGTLTRTTIVHYYVDWATQNMGPFWKALWLAGFAPMGAYYIVLDRFSREAFVRSFYRRYQGVRQEELEGFLENQFERYSRPRIYPEAEEAIRGHREQGHKIFLISGGLEPRVRPIAKYLSADDFAATRLEIRDGIFTGEIEGRPIVDDEKVNRIRQLAKKHGIDLKKSYAYGDSRSDLSILKAVGHPRVVGKGISGMARKLGWEPPQW